MCDNSYKNKKEDKVKALMYTLICILYFMLFFGAWLFIMGHLSTQKEENIVQIISTIITMLLLYVWIISSKLFSPILDRIIDKNERKYVEYIKQKYANVSVHDLKEEIWKNRSLEQPFPMMSYLDYERIESKRKICREYSDALKIRELDERISYLKRNIPIWIVVAIIFFCLGYVW